MTWFRQNRFLGTFLAVFAVVLLAVLYFLWSAKSRYEEARARFDENAAEFNRLQRLHPFPNEANLRKLKTQGEDLTGEVKKLREELKTRSLAVVPMEPNEFQARLRQALASVSEKAKANKVKLPDNFFLGFDEYAAALPDTAAAPILGQELAQAEMLVNLLLEARIDALTSFRRVPAPKPASTPAGPAAVRKPTAPAHPEVERNVVEASYVATPTAARRVLNQIASAKEQFYVVRTLHVLNEKDKGPAKEDTAAATAPPPPASNSAFNFIVGNERLQTAARIEMLTFARETTP